MPQIRQYNGGIPVTSILPTDAFVLDRIGTGTVWIEGESFLPDVGGLIINANNLILTPGYWGLQSNGGVYTGITLAPIAGLIAPAFIEISDLDNNVGNNNLTVHGGGALIADHGITASTFVWQVSNTILRITVNTNGSFTAITYGI